MNSIEKMAQQYAKDVQNNTHRCIAETAFKHGADTIIERLYPFLTHLCDTNVIDCHSVEEIVKKWEEWER